LTKGLPGRYLKVFTRKPLDSFSIVQTYEGVLNSLVKNIVIGGNEIYKLFKDDIDIWYVTYFKKAADTVDVYLDPSIIEIIENTDKTKEVILENDDLIIYKITKLDI
jgi:dihydrofolate reductase